MQVVFWGCRGSLPASYTGPQTSAKIRRILELAIEDNLRDKSDLDGFIENLPFNLKSGYGTNTPCVQIINGDESVICDAGSGIRDLGKQLVSMGPKMPKDIHILMSHLHWDHIQGFPFFIPAYIQDVTINIYGCHDTIEDAMTLQQETPTFPVALRDMGSNIQFHTLDVNESYSIAGMDIDIIEQPHPGTSYGYRFRTNQASVIYSTDAEHTEESQDDDYPFLDFIRDADLLIFDGQFNLADHLFTKQYWGHSSNLVGIELAARAGVKNLCLFHSEHTFTDNELQKFLEDSRRYLSIYDNSSDLKVLIAYDGLTLEF